MKIRIAIPLLLSLFFSFNVYASGIQTQLDNIFNDMSNYTAPGSFETQRTGGYFGGRYTTKSRIYNQDLVSFTAPSAKGGCGGIDVFGGSFSFVNSDQMVQLLRQVASNAKGYAFQLAMDNMCPFCIKWMNELQTKIQALNESLSNSCQLAQGVVNSTVEAWTGKHESELTIASLENGLAGDYAQLKKHIGTIGTAAEELSTNKPDKYFETGGAILYAAMKRNKFESWITGGDEELTESVLSMIGSIVIAAPVPKADGAPGPDVYPLPGGLITLKDIVEGGSSLRKYKCSATAVPDKCIIKATDTEPITISPLYKRIEEAFTGPSGLISRIQDRDYSGEPTAMQKNIMAASPSSLGSKIYLLAPISPEAAQDFVRDHSKAIALEIMYSMVKDTFRSARAALKSFPEMYRDKNNEIIAAADAQLSSDYKELSREYGDISKINEHYALVMAGLRKPEYVPNSHVAAGAK